MLQVSTHDDSDDGTERYLPNPPLRANTTVPSSPPPSFHSRSCSPSSRRLLRDESRNNEADQTLADAFGEGDESDADDEPDDRQRLMRANPEPPTSRYNNNNNINEAASSSEARTEPQNNESQGSGTRPRSTTILPSFGSQRATSGRLISSTNDGVFANLAAKPERGEKNEDLPPVCTDLHVIFSVRFLIADIHMYTVI